MINDIPITILRTDLFMRIAISIGVILIVYVIKKIIVLRINGTVKNIIVRHNYRRLTVYILGVIAFLAIVFVWLRRINFGIIFSIIKPSSDIVSHLFCNVFENIVLLKCFRNPVDDRCLVLRRYVYVLDITLC